MAGCAITTLLQSGWQSELEDIVLAEGVFVELDNNLKGIRQVILAITVENLLITEDRSYEVLVPFYVRHVTADVYLGGIELLTVLPIVGFQIGLESALPQSFVIKFGKTQRIFQLSTSHCNSTNTWNKWIDQILYIREDPYDFIKTKCEELVIPFLGEPPKTIETEKETAKGVEFTAPKALENVIQDFRQKKKSLICPLMRSNRMPIKEEQQRIVEKQAKAKLKNKAKADHKLRRAKEKGLMARSTDSMFIRFLKSCLA